MSKRQFLSILSLSVFFLVLIAIVGVYSMLKSVAIESKVSTNALPQKSSWSIKLSKASYKINGDILEDLDKSEFLRKTPGVEGHVFGPLKNGDIVCYYDSGSQSAYIEKHEGNKWIRLCDANIAYQSGSLGCIEYDSTVGKHIRGYMTSSKNCNDRLAPIEEGTYRLRTMVYTQCIASNGKWHNVDPASCKIREELYSPEFTVTQ